jgi:hypothetical protein
VNKFAVDSRAQVAIEILANRQGVKYLKEDKKTYCLEIFSYFSIFSTAKSSMTHFQ